MNTEHIRFVTVGFAELIANLPTVHCTWCGAPITNLGNTRTIGADVTLCDDYCYSDWAADSLAEDDAEHGLDHRDV